MKFKFYLSSLVFLLASFMMVYAQTNTVKGKITDGVEALYGVNGHPRNNNRGDYRRRR